MKRLFTLLMTAVLLVTMFALTSCSAKKSADSASTATLTSTPESSSASTAVSTEKKKVGIVQIVEHPSLDAIRETVIKEMAEKGFKDGENITIDYQNAQNDQTTLKTIVQKFVSSKYDLIIAIATPSAQAAAGETKDIPVLFSACTDPVSSGLVKDVNKPEGNVTGTSDAVSAEEIMKLAVRITPNIKKIGALYNSSETNSVSVINGLKEYAKNNGMTVVDATVTNSSEVQQATQSLAGKVDAIFSPIDNTVASAMPVVAQVANKAKIPVYVGADTMVEQGGLATYGVNYTTLGQKTGDMAADILNGKKISDIPVAFITDLKIYVNKDTAAAIGVKIPDDVMKEAAKVFPSKK